MTKRRKNLRPPTGKRKKRLLQQNESGELDALVAAARKANFLGNRQDPIIIEKRIEVPVEVPVIIPEGPEAKMTPFEEYELPEMKLNYWNDTFDFDKVTGHRNNIYEVYMLTNIRGSKKADEEGNADWWVNEMGVPMHWLSIKRLDQRAVLDWRHLQQIKTELVGPENEAFQLHPAESRLMDTANQFHLLVFADPWPVGIPIGWTARAVDDDQEMNKALGSRQREIRKN